MTAHPIPDELFFKILIISLSEPYEAPTGRTCNVLLSDSFSPIPLISPEERSEALEFLVGQGLLAPQEKVPN